MRRSRDEILWLLLLAAKPLQTRNQKNMADIIALRRLRRRKLNIIKNSFLRLIDRDDPFNMNLSTISLILIKAHKNSNLCKRNEKIVNGI